MLRGGNDEKEMNERLKIVFSVVKKSHRKLNYSVKIKINAAIVKYLKF